MSSEMVPSNNGGMLIPAELLAPGKYAEAKDSFSLVSTSSSFLPRFMLFAAGSNAVKKEQIGQGRFGIVRSKDDIEDLTKEVPVVVLGWRPKALEIDGSEVSSIFNPKSTEFKRISEKSEIKGSGCMFGPEFLLWVPTAVVPCFTTFFMCSKTARREAPNVKSLIGKAALLKSVLIETKQYSWFGPIATPYSGQISNMPDLKEIEDQTNRFKNPPENVAEKAEDVGDIER